MDNNNKTLVIVIHNSVRIHEKPSSWFDKIIEKYDGKQYEKIIKLPDTDFNFESKFYNYARNDEFVIREEYL